MKKHPVLLALFFAFSAPVWAQTEPAAKPDRPMREVIFGLGAVNLDNFTNYQLSFKKQIAGERYARFRLNGHFSGVFEPSAERIDIALAPTFGEETRRPLDGRLWWARGYEITTGLNYFSPSAGNWAASLEPAFGVVLALQYRFNDRLYLGIEGVPSASFRLRFAQPSGQAAFSINAGFQSAGALHVGVRF